jgi:phosphatidylserine/phosphatidylglycerophosphate/cardiolipin synthase-like enzyme
VVGTGVVVDASTGEGDESLIAAQRRHYRERLRNWDIDVVGREQSQQTWHWFGNGEHGVIAGLCDLLDRHLRRPRGRFEPAAIGCVPWFNHDGIAQRLAEMPSCIVIDKPKGKISPAAMKLHQRGQPVESEWFAALSDLAPKEPNGRPRIVGPMDRMGSSLGPLRVYGHRRRDNQTKPLLHAKMLVLGGTYEDDEDFTGLFFVPDVVWIGSANWTYEAANLHEEAAVVVADRSFVKDAAKRVMKIISESERAEWYAATPTPDLAAVELDMESIAEYAAEHGGSGHYDESEEDE